MTDHPSRPPQYPINGPDGYCTRPGCMIADGGCRCDTPPEHTFRPAQEALMPPDDVVKTLRGWAQAYRDNPVHRFPSDPHAEFFPVDLDAAANEIERLRAQVERPKETFDVLEGEGFEYAIGQLSSALADIDISAYNAAKWRIGKAVAVIRASSEGAQGMPKPQYPIGEADMKLATDWYTWGFQSGFDAARGGRDKPISDASYGAQIPSSLPSAQSEGGK